MYKTNYSVKIYTKQSPDESYELTGDEAVSAIAQMKSHRDVDTPDSSFSGTAGFIIPYHAIDSAIIEETREEVEYEDDNAKDCVIPEGATGTLTIYYPNGGHLVPRLRTEGKLSGTYSGYTFIYDDEDEESYTTLTFTDAVTTITIEGLPSGRKFCCIGFCATVPGQINLGDEGDPK